MNTPKPIKKLAWMNRAVQFGTNLLGKAKSLWAPAKRMVGNNKGTLGALGITGGLGYLMANQKPQQYYPQQAGGAGIGGQDLIGRTPGSLDSIYDGPAMRNIPAMQNPHRAAEYSRVQQQLTTPMFPKTGAFSRRLDKSAAMRDWRQLHQIFTSPPTVEDAQNVANTAIDKQKSRFGAVLPVAAGALGAGALTLLSRRLNWPKIPSQLSALASPLGNMFKTSKLDCGSTPTKWKKAPVQYNGDVDLSDLARTTKVDSKMPPTGKSNHFFKAGNNPDLLSQYVDTLFTTNHTPKTKLSSAFPEISAFSRGGNGTQQVPVPREPHPYIGVSHVLAKAGHTKAGNIPNTLRTGLKTVNSAGMPFTGRATGKYAPELSRFGEENIDDLLMRPSALAAKNNPYASPANLPNELNSIGGSFLHGPSMGELLGRLYDRLFGKQADAFDDLAAQEEAQMAARPELNLGEETNPDVAEAPSQPWSGNFGPPKPQAPTRPQVGPDLGGLVSKDPTSPNPPAGDRTNDILRILAAAGYVNQETGKPVQDPTEQQPPPQPQPPGAARAAVQKQLDSGVPPQQAAQASKAPVQAPVAQPAPQTPPAPAKAPTALPTSVQKVLQPPKPAPASGAGLAGAVAGRFGTEATHGLGLAPSGPMPSMPSAGQLAGSVMGAGPQNLAGPLSAVTGPIPGAVASRLVSSRTNSAPAAATAEDKPFQLPPNLANLAMQSKEETAAGQQAVQGLPQERTVPGSGGAGANNPPPEARPGDPAYQGGGSPVQEQPAVGRFYGALQRHKETGMDANRKAYLERTSKSRNMSASQRAEAQRELDRINAGGDNNIVRGMKQDQQLGAEDYLRQGFSPNAVAGWQGNNQTRNGQTVSTRGYWEQDAANQLAKEQGLPQTQNQYAAYVSPQAKGLQGTPTAQPVMGQGAGGVSMAQGRPTPMSPVRNMNAAQAPQIAGGMNNPGLKPSTGQMPRLAGSSPLAGGASLTPPKPPKPGIGSPLGVPGGKAAMYREKQAVGINMMRSAARFGSQAQSAANYAKMPWYGKALDFIGGSKNFAPSQRWYNHQYVKPWLQPTIGAASGAGQGAAIDSIAGLAGYDTDNAGMYAGAGLGGLARVPGVRQFMNRQGKNMGLTRNAGNIFHDQFKMTGHRNPILSYMGLPGKSLQSKIQSGLLFAGTGAGVVRNMAVNRGREAALGTADQIAQRFGFNDIDHMLQSPTGQFMAGYNRNGLLGGLQRGWGAMSPEQRYSTAGGLAGLAGGLGTMAFTDHDAAGLGMMGLGALGVGHGLGAFGGLGQQADAMTRSRDDMSRNEMNYAQG